MLAFYFLYELVGVSAVAGMAVLLVLVPTNMIGQNIGQFVLLLLPLLLATQLIGQNMVVPPLLLVLLATSNRIKHVFPLFCPVWLQPKSPLAGKEVETKQMALKDQRVLLMNEILQGIKVKAEKGKEVRI